MKTNARIVAGVLALGLVALPGLGRAQERQERPDQRDQREHRQLDLNNISPLEAIRNMQNTGRMIFMMADVNHDGQVSLQEAIDANNLMVGGFFFEADADGNGVVTQEESKRITDRYLNQNPWMRYVVDSLRAQAKQKNAQNSNSNPFLSLTAVLDTNNDRQVQASELRQLVQTVTQSFFAAGTRTATAR
jgi:hypothetical protein